VLVVSRPEVLPCCGESEAEVGKVNIGGLRTTELLIILAILILVFGVGRLGKIGGELGRGIRNFRQALSGGDEEEEEQESEGSDTL